MFEVKDAATRAPERSFPERVGAALSLERDELMASMLAAQPHVVEGDLEWRRVRRAAEAELMYRYPKAVAAVQSRLSPWRPAKR